MSPPPLRRTDGNSEQTQFPADELETAAHDSEDDAGAEERGSASASRSTVELPALDQASHPHPWNEVNEKQLRSALVGACKRMPRNAEAHFHLGLMYMRRSDGEEALRSFQHCRQIYDERMKQHGDNPPMELRRSMARLRSHTAQAAHLAAATKWGRDERAPLLDRLQKDLVAATKLDNTQPDVWNALALLHLNEGGYEGAREVLRSIRQSFPEYLDALNNLGLSELALGNSEAAIACFQTVILADRGHAEALSNYGLVLLRHGMYEAAARAFESAVEGSSKEGRGLSFAWGGLAIAHAALGRMSEAESAAQEAERTTDPLNRPKFTLLLISIRARRVTEELRRGVASDAACRSVKAEPSDDKAGKSFSQGSASKDENDRIPEDPRPAIDSAVLRLRSLARDIGTSFASTALGAVLRLRHDYSWEETANRNFGAEAAERLVEALEKDDMDAPAWVQLALLQMGTGEYSSARDFSVQAISRNASLEAAWNALAVSSQLNDETEDALKAYTKGIETIMQNYNNSSGKLAKDAVGTDEDFDMEDRDGDDDDAMEAQDESESRRMDTSAGDPQASSKLRAEMATAASTSGEADEKKLNKAGLSALAAMYNNLGNLKRQDGRSFNEAQNAYEKSLELGGESAVVYNNLALLYISANRFEDAEKMLEHALKLDPHFECALSNKLKLRSLMQNKSRSKRRSERQTTNHSTEVNGDDSLLATDDEFNTEREDEDDDDEDDVEMAGEETNDEDDDDGS